MATDPLITDPLIADPLVADPPVADPPITTPPVTHPMDFTFDIEVVDIYTLDTSARIPCSPNDLPINALVKSGYLGNTPITPTLAISLRTLELFWRIRSRKSSFSVDAFTKVICDLYSVCALLVSAPGMSIDISYL